MFNKRKPHGYWTKERVFEESKKYNDRPSFQKGSPSAYSLAKKHKWLDEMPNIKRLCKPNGYWKCKENVFRASKECWNISEFEKKYSAAYQEALRKGWIKEMTWFHENMSYKYIHQYTIYAYIDEKNKVAYIGLTNNKEERHKTHSSGLYKGRKSKTEVYKYFKNKNLEVPLPLYIEENLNSENAKKREKYWKTYYEKELGYQMLNIAPCGSLGGGSIKWTKEKVFDASKKVKTRTEFFKKYNTAYGIALKEKWIDEMFWLVSPQKPKNYWNINNVWNECKKYETLLELRQNCKSCYYAICKFKLNEEVKNFYKNLKKND